MERMEVAVWKPFTQQAQDRVVASQGSFFPESTSNAANTANDALEIPNRYLHTYTYPLSVQGDMEMWRCRIWQGVDAIDRMNELIGEMWKSGVSSTSRQSLI